jgi:probable rRNA maturation factor
MRTSNPKMTSADPPACGPIAVEISDTQAHLKVDPDALTRLVRRVLDEEGVGSASISIALVDDATIHAVNRRHLGHDWPTDVISFRLSDADDPTLAGELVVSAETASATAREVGTAPLAELALYVVHGLLHLCGYDDHADADVVAIRRREAEIMAGEGLTHTFAPTGNDEPRGAGRETTRWSV